MTHITNYCCLTSLKQESSEIQPPELMYWRIFFFFFFYYSTPGGPRLYHPLFPRLLKHSIKTLITLIPELFYLRDRKGEAVLPQNGMLFSEELTLPNERQNSHKLKQNPMFMLQPAVFIKKKGCFFFFFPSHFFFFLFIYF